MTIREARIAGTRKLRSASMTAALDAEILLAHALSLSREELLTHDDRPVPARAGSRYRNLIARRARHEPVAYLTGHKDFYGLGFSVNRHVLIPRPETELIVDLALGILAPRAHYFATTKKRAHEKNPSIIIDVGTGSGAIAVAIAKNLPAGRQAPSALVIAIDVSATALKIAKRNAVMHDVADRIVFRRGDLLTPAFALSTTWNKMQTPIIITANLPYLTSEQWRKTAPDVWRYEPRLALDGGKDGLRCYDELLHQIARFFRPKSGADARRDDYLVRMPSFGASADAPLKGRLILICEIDPSQKKSFPALVKKHFPRAKTQIKNDLAGRPRVVTVSI